MMRKMSVYSVRLNYIALHIALRYSTLIPSHYKCSPMYVHTPMHAFIRAYILTYLHTYIPLYLHKYTHTCRQPYIHTYIHTYIQACIHTYRHTDIPTDGWSQHEGLPMLLVSVECCKVIKNKDSDMRNPYKALSPRNPDSSSTQNALPNLLTRSFKLMPKDERRQLFKASGFMCQYIHVCVIFA